MCLRHEPKRQSFGRRAFTSRSGAIIEFTELGFGTAPVGNLYRAVDETIGAADPGGGLERRASAISTRLRSTASASRRRGSTISCAREPRADYRRSRRRWAAPAGLPSGRSGPGSASFSRRRRASEVFDYCYDGVMRSFEFSLERLGLDRSTSCSRMISTSSRMARRRRPTGASLEFMQSGYGALERLRGRGRDQGDRRRRQRMAGRARSWPGPAISTCSCSPGAIPCSNRRLWTAFCPIASSEASASSSAAPTIRASWRPGRSRAPSTTMSLLRRPSSIASPGSSGSASRHGVKLVEAALRFPLGHRNVRLRHTRAARRRMK